MKNRDESITNILIVQENRKKLLLCRGISIKKKGTQIEI